MSVVREWHVQESPGWTADYRVVSEHTGVFPVRIDRHWYRGPYMALQVMYAEESPPTPWITVRKARDEVSLLLEALL